MAESFDAYTKAVGGSTAAASPGGESDNDCSSPVRVNFAATVDDQTLNEELKRVPQQVLLDAYQVAAKDDHAVPGEAHAAYLQELERNRRRRMMLAGGDTNGLVNRRAPLNPFASRKLGKYRQKTPGAKDGPKVADPALRNNPIYGKLLMCICSSAILMFVFFQALLANKIDSGSYYASASENKMIGPQGITLLNLGALNANYIRNKSEWFRIFWAFWMHSGWIHIGLNVLSQLQNLWMFEPDWGFLRCLFIYCVSGICGNLTSLLFNPCSTTVGSSGCLFGLMGAMVTYCIEFWETIPRPLCVMLFSLIVAAISLVIGFTSGTDNWAHMGGLIGGFASSLLTTPRFPRQVHFCGGSKRTAKELAEEREKRARRPARVLTRWMPCLLWSWDMREALVRICSAIVLIVYIICCTVIFFKDYEYQPVGQPTFTSSNKCCCCYSPADYNTVDNPWQCYQCDTMWTAHLTYGEWCSTNMAKDANAQLKDPSKSLMDALHLTGMTTHALFEAPQADTVAEEVAQTNTLFEAAAAGKAPYTADARAARKPTLQGRLPAPATPFYDLLPGAAVAAARKNVTVVDLLDRELRASSEQLKHLPKSKEALQPLFKHNLSDAEAAILLHHVSRFEKRHDIIQGLVGALNSLSKD